jgi:hypothetical protein
VVLEVAFVWTVNNSNETGNGGCDCVPSPIINDPIALRLGNLDYAYHNTY